MLKKIIAGVLGVTVAVSSGVLPEAKMVFGADRSFEQQLEQEYREMEAEVHRASDGDLREECDSPLSGQEITLWEEEAFTSGTTEYDIPEIKEIDPEAAFFDGETDFFTDEGPGEFTDPDDPEIPEEPDEPTVPEEPADPEAPINPETPYDPEIPEGVTEVTMEVTEGEDIAWKLNGYLIKMKERATDAVPCKVIIPPGNYVVTKTICTYSNIHIYAAGATITKVSPDKKMLLRLGNKEGSEGGYNGYRNITIEGGTWDINFDTIPNKEEEGGCTGFRLGHATNVVIKDVTLKNNLKSHLIELAGVKNARITGCVFSGYWEEYEGGAQECIQMDICHEKYFPNYSPSDRSVCENIYIEGNTFENSFAGVGCHSMSFNKPFKNIVIRNNTFRNIRKRCVWITNAMDSVVENNAMTNVGGGIYARSMYSHCAYINEGQNAVNTENQYPLNLSVKNNEIVLNAPEVIGTALWKSFGIYLGGEKCVNAENNIPNGTYPIRKVTVTGNKVSGPGKGIQCVLAEECRISGNTFDLSNAGEYTNMGIALGGSNSNTVSGNIVQGSVGPGIYIYRGAAEYARPGKNNILSGNTVSGGAADGIAVNRTCDNTIIEKNTVNHVAGNGISVWKNSKASVKLNKVNESGLSGILVSGGKNTSVTENTVSSCAGDGIRTEDININLTVNKNTSKKNKGCGFLIEGSDSSIITENTADKNEKYGIHVMGSRKVSLIKNKVKKSTEYGIFGTNASITVYKANSLKDNGFYNTIYLVNASLPY